MKQKNTTRRHDHQPKKIFGEEHAAVATSYNNLGIVYQILRQYNEAKAGCYSGMIINKKIFGEEHAAVATSYNNLGSFLKILDSTMKQKNTTKRH